ncbi:gamma subclass chorismate mutase AroQ [Curtobacterium sp. UCD-KPL2560]|uniref:gamma subclass chorismate mutase AroQ n=1 Tax=Curtobacterium sp. UCD-KPL2560 TaxID=1885315 RepID=UPI0009F61958|nr:gamma subclass chorismate mutase AroQ [Curtobacterium sp. UCD-KPL2560]
MSAQTPNRSRPLSVVVACCALLLSLTACSGPGNSAHTSASATAATTAPSAPSGTARSAAIRSVVALVVERLGTAPQVAAAKFHSGQAVDDPARERVVLDAARSAAEQAGVDPDWVEAVFADQVAANKVAQYTLLASWTRDPDRAPATAPDLGATVRPVLDRITPELVSGLASARAARSSPRCGADVRAAVAGSDVDESAVRDALSTAVAHLCGAGRASGTDGEGGRG